MSALLAMTIAGILRPVKTGILSIGSACTSDNDVEFPADAPYSASMNCTLPDGCAAGDVVVLSCNVENFTQGVQWVEPDGALTVLYSLAEGAMIIAVFAYTLTQTDVDAASVAIPLTATQGSLSLSATVIVDAYRNLGAGLIDVTGVPAGSTLSGDTLTATAPGVTTPRTGDMLQYAVFATSTTVYTITQPDGFTGGAVTSEYWGNTFTTTGHALQQAAGASGDETVTVAWPAGQTGTYTVMLLALQSKAVVPMTLTGTIPDGTAGGEVDATLTLAGDFTAPVTISGLPTWLSATVSDTDVEVTGTYPSTADTYTFTITATDSSATPQTADDAQSIVVSEASASPTLVQQTSGYRTNTASPIECDLAAAPTAGNTLVIVCTLIGNGDSSVTVPDGFTRQGTFAISGSSRGFAWYTKTSDGSEQSIELTWSTQNSFMSLAYQEWDAPIDIADFAATFIDAAAPSGITIGPSSAPPNDGAIPCALVIFGVVSTADAITGYESPWLTAPEGDVPSTNAFRAIAGSRATSSAAVSAVLDCDYTGSGGYYKAIWWVTKA